MVATVEQFECVFLLSFLGETEIGSTLMSFFVRGSAWNRAWHDFEVSFCVRSRIICVPQMRFGGNGLFKIWTKRNGRDLLSNKCNRGATGSELFVYLRWGSGETQFSPSSKMHWTVANALSRGALQCKAPLDNVFTKSMARFDCVPQMIFRENSNFPIEQHFPHRATCTGRLPTRCLEGLCNAKPV